jgi:hypothetical protein
MCGMRAFDKRTARLLLLAACAAATPLGTLLLAAVGRGNWMEAQGHPEYLVTASGLFADASEADR